MAETNFHFLVNALPDVASLAADEIDEVRYLIESNLDHESLHTFRFLLYRNDNKNLLKLMRKRDGILPKMADRFNTPAVFSFEDLDDMLIDAYEDEAEIPGYLAEFLQEERQSNWAVRERENRLVDLYYEAGTCYPQDFISAMFLFKRDLKNILLALNARMQGRLALIGLHGARAHLAGLLLELSRSFGVRDSSGVIIDLRLTHRELAALIGATRETVSVAIVEIRNAGLVRTEQRRVVITDLDGLIAMAEAG